MDLKIFVSHRSDLKSQVVKNEVFYPVECGSSLVHTSDLQRDDEGDNISLRKDRYSELTVQYWAWRNCAADYYGLCHYRRYFSFSEKCFEEDKYGNVIDEYIDSESMTKYRLGDICSIKSLVDSNDIIVASPFNVKNAGHTSLIDQWNSNSYLKEEDLDLLKKIIADKSPEYIKAADDYLNSNIFYPCSLFIMSKRYFNEYSTWLFSILFEIEKNLDFTNFSEDRTRVLGHLGERMLGIFLTHIKKRDASVKIKVLQRVIFFKPDSVEELHPVYEQAIPVVLSSSDYYVPYLYTTLFSTLKHKSQSDIYDVIILHESISTANRSKIKGLERIFNGVHIRFFNISPLIKSYTFKANNHVSVETFYRLFIPVIFKNFKKIVFLDSDLIVLDNVGELYRLSDDNATISATRDAEYQALYFGNENVRNYTQEVLKISDVKKYFQAGVIVFNVERFNNCYSLKELLDFASSREFMFVDQDVLNSFLQDDVKYLPMRWNVMTDCAGHRINNIRTYAPLQTNKLYKEARLSPSIIHYAGFAKPWDLPWDDFAEEFWKIARETIFYESILYRMSVKAQPAVKRKAKKTLKSKIKSKLKKLIGFFS